MEPLKELKTISRNVYNINIFNVNSSEKKNISIGIVFFHGPGVYDAVFSCLDDGFHYQSITGNIFGEYQKFREPLEIEGWRFKTKGVLKNMRPSGMQLDSFLGVTAYLFEEGKSEPESFNIFDYEDTISENDTVEVQNTFWENYVRSRSGGKV